MDYFKATYDENEGTISIASNTYWVSKVEGNFMLSKYSGIGNDTLAISAPEDIQLERGTIYFSYGENSCIVSPPITVLTENSNYFSINPSYAVFHGKGSVATIVVNSANGYKITNNDLSTFRTLEYGGNKLMIISNTDNSFNKYIEVRNLSSNVKKRINIIQQMEDNQEKTSLLTAYYSMIDNNTFSISVISLHNNVYNSFTWDVPDGITIAKQDNNTLIAKVSNSEIVGESFNITFKNDDTTYSLTLYRKKDSHNEEQGGHNTGQGSHNTGQGGHNTGQGSQSRVFDVAVECNGEFMVGGGTLRISVLSQTVDNIFDIDKLIKDNQKLNNTCLR